MKRTAKRLCVTNVTGLLFACLVMIFTLYYCVMVFYKTSCLLKEQYQQSLDVSGKLPTYSSPKPTLTFTSHLGQNVGLGEG